MIPGGGTKILHTVWPAIKKKGFRGGQQIPRIVLTGNPTSKLQLTDISMSLTELFPPRVREFNFQVADMLAKTARTSLSHHSNPEGREKSD